jgi:hypothetical protein
VALCGAAGDPQGLDGQAAALRAAGALVTRSSAQAARLALAATGRGVAQGGPGPAPEPGVARSGPGPASEPGVARGGPGSAPGPGRQGAVSSPTVPRPPGGGGGAPR